MHRRRTPKTLSKPPPIQGPPKKTIPEAEPAQNPAPSTPDGVQFELELCWCVQQLQDALNGGKLSQKLAEDTAKNLKILTSSTAPLIRKRQVMKQSMGDYRAKMQQEEKKLMLASKQVKFTPAAAAPKKSSFVKKSALLTTGKDFRFDFALPADTNENSGVSASQPVQTSSLPQSSAGTPFKFNFTIEEESANNLNLSGLMLT
ncbi:UPF0488 protein CG14286 [Drosophila kikkawai]|uniref:UPF0488 protein CG14286 n=1 Tax=Drosophila kikkawai TaxID=30033 RepID=A0A6P4J188_DROKI|nr:UPF0488 protein CG14286 [Drosophila kikkawai]KAH8343467.1 hypothetical protein KR059_011310 [Drosophila kikkawai]